MGYETEDLHKLYCKIFFDIHELMQSTQSSEKLIDLKHQMAETDTTVHHFQIDENNYNYSLNNNLLQVNTLHCRD